jgi:hypothetical protein
MSVINVDSKDKYPRVYWPEELKRFGYTGEVEVICDPVTATVIHPGATPEQVIQSLENRIRDIQLRKPVARSGFRPLESQGTLGKVEKAPEVEWENIQCPYPDCGAPLRWNLCWEQAACSRCGRMIVRYQA